MSNQSSEVIVPYHGAEKVLVAVRKIIFDTEPGALRPMSTQIMIKTLVNDGMPEALAKKLPSQIRKGKPLFLEWKAAFLSGRFMQKIGRSIKVASESEASLSPSSMSKLNSSSLLAMKDKQLKRESPSMSFASNPESYQAFLHKKCKVSNNGDYNMMGVTTSTAASAGMVPEHNAQKFSNISTNFQHIVSSLSANYGARSMVHPYSNNFKHFPSSQQNHFNSGPPNMGYFYSNRVQQQQQQQQQPHRHISSSQGSFPYGMNASGYDAQPVLTSSSLLGSSLPPTTMPASFDSHVFEPMRKFPDFTERNFADFAYSNAMPLPPCEQLAEEAASRSRCLQENEKHSEESPSLHYPPSQKRMRLISSEEERKQTHLCGEDAHQSQTPSQQPVDDGKANPNEDNEAANVLLLLSCN